MIPPIDPKALGLAAKPSNPFGQLLGLPGATQRPLEPPQPDPATEAWGKRLAQEEARRAAPVAPPARRAPRGPFIDPLAG